VAVEIDGFAFHHAPDRFQRDRTRQNALVGLGWTVLRFTWAT
jgi:very-short-patch-repair endonuclease